ncbi:hypothetical protein B0A49_00370 [Cryomyces minteri]|uniref:Uncharacterized protein n=1 Tax=Cryomyces minteri TaxID=331657 RepID=A0A4U0XVQ2_9PEZI|nr:hypothetical protein B0A49_00370 [Cryomyces minteri]
MPSETSRLLHDDYEPAYGGANATLPHGPAPDPEEIRRERDALERLCAQTSDKLIDVSQPAFADAGSKMTSEYPRLFSQRFPSGEGPDGRPETLEARDEADEDEAKWIETSPAGHVDTWDQVEEVSKGALTIQLDSIGGGRQMVQ